jgi:hypothetical protein
VLPDVYPVIGHLIRSSQQIREDLEKALAPLSPAQIWESRVGFHAKHLAGSTRRLCAYLQGRALTQEELADIQREHVGNETASQLIEAANDALDAYEREIGKLRPEDFGSLREVGRNRLPVTAIGLAIHIAEHGQRHAGQAIEAAKRLSDG